MRPTLLRNKILKILNEARTPVSANDLLKLLQENHKNINKTTVYRNMELFKRNGYINEVFFKDTVVRYEAIGKKCHHHLLCDSCGMIEDFEFNENDFFKKAIGSTNFLVKNHNIELFGICKNCHKS